MYSEKILSVFLFEMRLKYFSSFQTRKARLFGVKSRFGVAARDLSGDRFHVRSLPKRAFPSENLAVSLRIP